MDGDKFDTYVRTRLAPTLEPGDVVIWDNLNVHKKPESGGCHRRKEGMDTLSAAIFARQQSD
jgi:hypothetical protein